MNSVRSIDFNQLSFSIPMSRPSKEILGQGQWSRSPVIVLANTLDVFRRILTVHSTLSVHANVSNSVVALFGLCAINATVTPRTVNSMTIMFVFLGLCSQYVASHKLFAQIENFMWSLYCYVFTERLSSIITFAFLIIFSAIR